MGWGLSLSAAVGFQHHCTSPDCDNAVKIATTSPFDGRPNQGGAASGVGSDSAANADLVITSGTAGAAFTVSNLGSNVGGSALPY